MKDLAKKINQRNLDSVAFRQVAEMVNSHVPGALTERTIDIIEDAGGMLRFSQIIVETYEEADDADGFVSEMKHKFGELACTLQAGEIDKKRLVKRAGVAALVTGAFFAWRHHNSLNADPQTERQ